ncbi:Intracellular multiplication and human macrophage-killing [Vibrio aerogenes CECT 7868]|uniref:Intracellular multiplication and human macrophage-killing n=3 Tax=Vibrio aerogenes TaxID=92172 RepID=A0A1M5VWU1_9VIBR|nr:Intracellular multiplication and human macrophage-killing [Vibrio aerogenes CECT 7868]
MLSILKKVFALLKKIKLKPKPGMLAVMPMLLFLCFILINVAIWWAGPWLTLYDTKPLESVTNRAVATTVFWLLVAAIWGVWQWKKLQGYEEQQEREERFRQDPIKLLEEKQEAELNKVIANMRKNINKRDFLYTHPWYLVLGLENAGKTSLINRSGQNFTMTSVMRASGQKSENPYSFDWWIGDKAVVIDPDGELLTQGHRDADTDGEMERRLWKHFVEWLERTRNRRPLNGIVLALDVSHLASVKASERKAYASILRARVREIVETMSIQLPVYIALTKLDLLYGFEPFFKNFTKEQREEALGFTFQLKPDDDDDQWLAEFENEYGQFVDTVNEMLPVSASAPMELDERNGIYSFSRQVAGLKDILTQFLREALGNDQYSLSAIVRGVYFTSVYQQGVPSNAFDDAASRRYGLEHAINKAQIAKNSTVYFTNQLFTKIIYTESGLASDNKKVIKQKRRLLMLSTVACSIVTLLLFGSWQKYYLSNVNHSDAVLTKVNQFKNELPKNIYKASQQDMLDSLNKIREATLEFGFFRNKSQYFADMGLYQGHTIGPMVESTYLNMLETRFLPILISDVIVQLNQAQTDEEKLDALRVFRMMTDKSGRYKDMVLDYFGKYWQQEFPGKRLVQEELLGHLDYAMDHTNLAIARAQGDKNADKVLRPYDQTIAQVQTELSTMPNRQRVYRNLKQNAQTILGPDINLRNLIGPVFDLVFDERVVNSDGLYIPQMLTKKGFEEYFIPQVESVSKLALIDSWVLGQSKSAEFSEADKQKLRDQIRELYVSDYTKTWRAALAEIDMKYFSDMNDAVSVLENITSSVEPIQRLMRTLEENTKLFDIQPKDEEAQKELLKQPKYRMAAAIDTPFADLNSMLTAVGDKPAYINEVIGAVDELKLYLKGIQASPDEGMAALNATKSRMKLVNADPIYTLRRIASGLPTPLDRILTKLSDESWHVIKQEAIKYLEVRWHNDVYRVFEEKLANRYPFNPASKKDASLADFESFFAPNGILDSFYQNQLKIFIDEKSVLGSESEGSQGVVKNSVLEQLKQAKQIREAFFNRKGILDVSFSVEPLRLTSNKRRSVLNVDGQFLTYSHGSRENAELIWPNTLRDSAISKITLIPAKSNLSPRSIVIQGPWAFFRLLDFGDVIAASSTSVDYRFRVDHGDMIYRINSEDDVNPFTQRLFKSFKLSANLY